MLPFIQCHQTRGRALAGGFSKPLLSGSACFCAAAMPRLNTIVRLAVTIFVNLIVFLSPEQIRLGWHGSYSRVRVTSVEIPDRIIAVSTNYVCQAN